MKEKLQKDMIESMKAHNKKRLDVIKLLKASIQMEEKNTLKELNDNEITNIIVKQVKMRRDALNDFKKANRQDLIDQYNEEIDVLNEYLPKPLTDEEVNNIIDEAFKTIKPQGQKDMGKIMKEVTPKLKARADMGKVNQIIKDKLLNL